MSDNTSLSWDHGFISPGTGDDSPVDAISGGNVSQNFRSIDSGDSGSIGRFVTVCGEALPEGAEWSTCEGVAGSVVRSIDVSGEPGTDSSGFKFTDSFGHWDGMSSDVTSFSDFVSSSSNWGVVVSGCLELLESSVVVESDFLGSSIFAKCNFISSGCIGAN
jgi:hypothetical protein